MNIGATTSLSSANVSTAAAVKVAKSANDNQEQVVSKILSGIDNRNGFGTGNKLNVAA